MNDQEKLYPSKILLLILKKIELLEKIFDSGVSHIINKNSLDTITWLHVMYSFKEPITWPEEKKAQNKISFLRMKLIKNYP